MLSKLTAVHTMKDVKRLKLRPPDGAGSYWTGTDFSKLLEAVEARAEKRGWAFGSWVIDLSRGGTEMVASATLQYRAYPWKGHRLYTPGIGLAVSNQRRRALRFYLGVVPNGTDSAVVTEAIHPKHRRLTLNFDVAGVVEEVFSTWSDHLTVFVPRQVQALTEKNMTVSDVDLTLMAAGRADLMPCSRIVRVHDAWLAREDRSAWGLAIAFGHVAAINTPVRHMDRLLSFFNLLTGKPAAVAVG